MINDMNRLDRVRIYDV